MRARNRNWLDLWWINRQLRPIVNLLLDLKGEVMRVQEAIDGLKADVADLSSVVSSAVALIDGLAPMLEEAKDDPEEISAIAAALREQKGSLANAVARNTAASTEPPAPEPEPGPAVDTTSEPAQE
jgi:hypothetical protein